MFDRKKPKINKKVAEDCLPVFLKKCLFCKVGE